MTKQSVAQICAFVTAVTLPTLSWAGTTTRNSTKGDKPAPAPEKLSESIISGNIGVNVVTAYYYRGVMFANHSYSVQPSADLNIKAIPGDDFSAILTLGVWSSHSKPGESIAGRAPQSPRNWTQFNITPGVTLDFGKISISESLHFYEYPNTGLESFEGLHSRISFDDSDLSGALALHPSIAHMKELSGKAAVGSLNSNNARTGTEKGGDYWEAAIAPGVSVGPVTLTLPVTLGFGSGKFYQRNGYAYLAAGMNFEYALPMLGNYGRWTATAGATYYNTDREVTGNSQQNDVVGSLGLGISF
jgi:hypothetical protein